LRRKCCNRVFLEDNWKCDKIEIPKFPIALVHGMGGDKLIEYFTNVRNDFQKMGIRVIQPKVPRYGTIEVRAKSLQNQLQYFLNQNQVKKVNIIAHSMGGLDSRFLISFLGGETIVESLTTIASPHHGSSFCDYWVDNWINPFNLNSIFQILPMEIGAWNNLTTYYLKNEFNEKAKNDKSVSYYSISGDPQITTQNIFYPSYRYILNREGPNDGLVSVNSSQWGTHLGTVPLDHMKQIGWSITPDHIPLYRKIISFLVSEGH